jgi:carboxypeptidase C (cathepsin A)
MEEKPMPHPRPFPATLLGLVCLAWLVAPPAEAQQRRPGAPPAASGAGEAAAPATAPTLPDQPLPAESVSSHSITLGGRSIAYTARAGALDLRSEQGEKSAEIFYIAYLATGLDAKARPITFVFNGGPGAASAYLHLGALGPRVLDFGDPAKPPQASAPLIDNPDSWLDATDLVFIDPVGTGYSHAMNSVRDVPKAFWGTNQDLQALEAAIRVALTRFDRFGSPLYLVGESYGGFRGAKLVNRLPADKGIAVAGAMLISPVLEFSLQGGDDFNALPWALHLPSMAAVSLDRQGKLSPAALAPVERFALTDYLAALTVPPADAESGQRLYARIAGILGLPQELVARWQGRLPTSVFTKEIRHGEGEVASSYDAAIAGSDPYPAANARGSDPIFDGIKAPLATGMLAYLRDELGYKTERAYTLLNGEVSQKWEWGNRGPSGTLGASDDMRKGLAGNAQLRITIAHGMTDLVTPYMSSRYVVDHLPAKLTDGRVALTLYPGGHMMYLRPASRAALHADAASLYGAVRE